MITHLYKSGKKVLPRMPFLPQPSPFIRAWDRHQETQKCASDGWVDVENDDTLWPSLTKGKGRKEKKKK